MTKKSVLDVDTIHTAAVADDQHKFADEATQSVFGTLAGSTTDYTSRHLWEGAVMVIEDQYMEATQAGNPDAKTKGTPPKGKKAPVPPRWKYRTYLPAAWSSSKSVCGSAMDAGIALDKDSKKTATEQAIKDFKDENKDKKTAREKIHIAMETAKKVLATVPTKDREKMRIDINALYGVDTNNGYWGI